MSKSFSFQWHITDVCDQRCKHCYIYSGDAQHVVQESSWEEIERILSNCLDFSERFKRTPHFYVTGGDPLLHPEFWRLAAKLHSLGLSFSILGNPYHLTDAVCTRLYEFGCVRYQLSLDGLRQTHDWFRKPGSYDCTLEKLGVLNRSGVRSVVMTTVSRRNNQELLGIIDAVVAAEAKVFAFTRYVPSGNDELADMLRPQEYRTLLAQCNERFEYHRSHNCTTWFNKKDHLWTLYDYECGRFTPTRGALPGMIYDGCNCGNCHWTILPNGDVYACRRVADSRVGNALTDRLVDLWLGAMERYRNYERFVQCCRCKLLPYCRGCPAVARGHYGDFYQPDPQCWAKDVPGLWQ